MNALAMNLLFTVLPPILNKMAANPRAWSAAQMAVAVAKVAIEHGNVPKGSAVEIFNERMKPVLAKSEHPVSSENFLREAAVLYDKWKAGKIKKK